MDTREPSPGKPQEPKKLGPIEELQSHGATLWRETQRLEAKLNEVIRAVNWLLSQK